MKSIRFLTCLIFLSFFSSLMAYDPEFVWEWQFSIKSGSQFISESITVYYYDSSSKNYIECGGGTSLNYGYWGDSTWNAVANISGVDPDQYDATFTIPSYNEYIVRIGNQFVRIQNIGCTDETFTYDGSSIGTQNYSVIASGSWTNNQITLKNNFAGGAMYINSELHSGMPLNGEPVTRESTTFPHELTAIDEQTASDGYKMLWDKWSDTHGSLSRELSTAGNYTGYQANFDKECHLTFQTDGKPFTADGENYSSDQTLYKRERINFTAVASNTNKDDVDYTFLYWKKDGTVVSNTINVSAHATYVANYSGKPTNGYRSMEFNTSNVGEPIQISWNAHPLDNNGITEYAIYRKVTTQGTPTLIATVSATGAGSYSYVDEEYIIVDDDPKILLFYDVRAYYAPSSAYSDVSFEALYGYYNINTISNNSANITKLNNEIPNEYSVSNFPNPFNPTTTINYQLPQEGFVTLKVYDIVGKEVATLVNENKNAGYYNVTFDASKLTSGIYIYMIRANNYVQSKKMLLVK
jgi:hypothetical protein